MKSWSPPIVEMMTVKMIVGRIIGTVMCQNCLQRRRRRSRPTRRGRRGSPASRRGRGGRCTRPAPGDHHRERDPGREAPRLPVDRADPDPAEQVVEQPVVAREELREDQRDGDERRHLREQDAHAEERPPAELGVEQVREREREQELGDSRDHPDPERVLDRVPEVRVVEERGVVVEPDEVRRRVEQVPVGQRHPRRVAEREQPEGAEDEEERADVEVGRDDRVEAVQPAAGRTALCASRRVLDLPRSRPAFRRMRESSTTPAAPGHRAVAALPGAARRMGYLADVLDVLEELGPRLRRGRLLLLDPMKAAVEAVWRSPWCGPRICGFSLSAELAKTWPTGALLKNGFLKFWTAALFSSAGWLGRLPVCLKTYASDGGRGQELDQVSGLVLMRSLLRDGEERAAPVAARAGRGGDVPLALRRRGLALDVAHHPRGAGHGRELALLVAGVPVGAERGQPGGFAGRQPDIARLYAALTLGFVAAMFLPAAL